MPTSPSQHNLSCPSRRSCFRLNPRPSLFLVSSDNVDSVLRFADARSSSAMPKRSSAREDIKANARLSQCITAKKTRQVAVSAKYSQNNLSKRVRDSLNAKGYRFSGKDAKLIMREVMEESWRQMAYLGRVRLHGATFISMVLKGMIIGKPNGRHIIAQPSCEVIVKVSPWLKKRLTLSVSPPRMSKAKERRRRRNVSRCYHYIEQ